MGVQLPRPEQPSAPLMPALRYDVSRCQNLTSPREGARRMTGGRPFSDSLLRGIAPREADIRLTTLLWPSALACLSAKSRRRARAQTGPSCAVDDPNEDGDSDYCEGSDDRGSSGLRWSRLLGQVGGEVKLIPDVIMPPVWSSDHGGHAPHDLKRRSVHRPLPGSAPLDPSAVAACCSR